MHLDLGMQPILSHLLTGANITTCNSCFEDEFLGDDVAKCNKNQRIVACSDGAFPNLGTTHCFTAAGRYGNNTFVSTGILRGCINCTGKINSSIPHFFVLPSPHENYRFIVFRPERVWKALARATNLTSLKCTHQYIFNEPVCAICKPLNSLIASISPAHS